MARTLRRRPAAERPLRVIFERDDGDGWFARVPEEPSLSARGGSIAQARKRIRTALGEHGRRAIREEVILPRAGTHAAMRLAQAREALVTAEREAVAVLVRRLGLGVRDASEALGLSMRRVVHLAGECADLEAERKHARRAAAASPTQR